MRDLNDRQRGDTIVEVLISLAVLTTVLGGAYVASSRNALTSRASQERNEAVKLAEGQIEKLRVITQEDPTIFSLSTAFCVTQNAAQLTAVSANNASCYISAAGVPVAASFTPRYHVSITKDADVSAPGVTGARFSIALTWANVRGDGDDSLETKYEVYR